MKQTLIFSIFFISISMPSVAQWKRQGNLETFAIYAHDTSLFFSQHQSLFRLNPNGEADSGLDFTQGNFTTFASAGPNVFAGSYNSDDGGVGAISTNNGATWKTVIGGPVGSNGTLVFAHYAHHLACSTDNGSSWQHLSYPDGTGYVGADSVMFMVTSSYWVGTSFAGLWRSLDSGYTWSKIPRQPPFMGTLVYMSPLLFMYQNYRAAFDGSSVPHNGILILSKDSGMTWDTVQVDSAGMPEYVTTVATDGKNLFVGGVSSRQDPVAFTNLGNGFYVSTDTGKNWRAVNDGLGNPAYDPFNVEAIGIYVHDSAIYISTNNNNYGGSNPSFAGYYRPLKEVLDSTKDGVKSVADNAISDSLSIYPNPLSGITTISLTGIPFATVEIYDLLGREVEHFRMAGSFEWNASRLPAGTYIVHVTSGSFDQIRRVTIER